MNAPTMVEGWMGKKARRWLARTARDHARIIEVGVWKGLTTQILAAAAPRGHVWAVDHWLGVPGDPAQQELYAQVERESPAVVRAEFVRNVSGFSNVTVVEMDSVAAADHLLGLHGATFDFVFIDADHSYEGAKRDIEAYRRLVWPGGILSGHDYKPTWPGVMRAVDEAFGDRVTIGPKSIWSIEL